MSRRPVILLALALGSAAAAVLVWLAAFVVPGGHALDAAAMRTFNGVAQPPLEPSIMGVAHLADLLPFLLAGGALVALALLRRRPLMALVTGTILGGANLTTQLLQPGLGDLRVVELQGVQMPYPGSWPSGHATASMSLALCLVLVVGPRLRPLAAVIGAGYAVAVAYALVALGWHLPSDVVGGFLVAATFSLAGAASLALLESRLPGRAAQAHRPPALLSAPALGVAVVLVVGVVGVVAIATAPWMAFSALRHPPAIAAGAGIAALGLALTAGLAAALRR